MNKIIEYLKEEPNNNGVKRWEFYASIIFGVGALFFSLSIIYIFVSKVFC